MARTTSAKSKSTSTANKKGCTLNIKPKILAENLNLLNAAVSSNKQGIDRLKIEVGNGQSIFSVGGDIGVEIRHKATKTLNSKPVQVSCRQIKSLASNLDSSNQKLTLREEQVTISNQKGTYQHSLVTYFDVIPQDNSEYTPLMEVEATKFKQALDKVIPFLNSDSKEITSGVCLQIESANSADSLLTEDTDREKLQLTLVGLSEPGMGKVTITVDSVETNQLNSTEDVMVILPKKAATFIASYAQDFILSVADKSVRFEWANVRCNVQTLKGKYPDLDRIEQSVAGNDVEIEFNKNDLASALKRHQVVSSEIEFKVEEENCQLSQSTETGSGAENIYCSNDSTETIKLNLLIDYVIKVLTSVESQTVMFKLNLEPDEDKGEPSNNVLIKDKDATYCLSQLIAEG
ncbi:MAG: hypothetical protein WBM62_04300 [Crocosphaera sp.]